jgi:hypothetical protein
MNTAFQKLDASAQPMPAQHAIVRDPRTGLMWTADNVGSGRMTHAEATKAAAGVAFGGFTDWRLPTIQELLTLVDYSRHNPAIDDAFRCHPNAYWTSSPGASAPADCAWLVNFYGGGSDYNHRDNTAFVRAVRVAGAGQ